jgi:uncharacterized membrane protein
MFAKVRLDALSDGIFAVAMTLLILDIRRGRRRLAVVSLLRIDLIG